MTENKRILLNIAATYGRSLYGIVLGLLCGRWSLMALGEVDYGLYGLVGGLVVFISFFNNILAGANSRFYAFTIGAANTASDKAAALEESRRWFNVSLFVHMWIPIVLVAIGYPIGVYAIEHWLTIPSERILSCVWVFRFVCASCFVAMINVPFSAMYGARQYLAELTIYSFIQSTLNAVILYYMITHPGVWIVKYAAWTCIINVIPQIFICLRACIVFPECHLSTSYMWDVDRLKKLGGFAGWQFIGCLCGMLRTQGMMIVINKFFGATMNAAQAIGNHVQGQCTSFAGAMQGAFVPVITQACGAGDYIKMNKFVIRTCKFNVLLSLMFMVPLAIELPQVMKLWLGNPPSYSVGLCYCAMLFYIVGCCTVGHMVAVIATGKIASYYLTLGSISIFTLPLAILAGYIFRDVFVVSACVIFMECINSVGRIYFAKLYCGTSVGEWFKNVFIPLLASLLFPVAVGILPRFCMAESFLRVCVTTILCEAVYLPLSWFVSLSDEERKFVINKFGPRLRGMFGR
jgi:O-antigen/teichoic acid export membrane protein